jgi:type I restriction enzyme R subunit
MGFIFAILFLICILWAIFYFELSRLMATAIIIFASLFAAIFISPWSLLLGLPLIILSLIVVIDPLRKSLITQPAYKALAKAMPSMSSTEREALDAGTSWWEKLEVCRDLFHGYDYSNFQTASDLECAQIIKGGVNFIMSPAKQEQHQIFLKEALLLHNSLTLCRSLLDESQRYEAAFFEAVRTLLSRMTGKGKVSKREINARIGELLKHSIKSEGVINLFSDVKAEFSLFDAAFLDDISKMKEKNIAVELLKRLLAERVTLYQKTNIVQAEKFSDLLNRSLSNYLKGLLTNEEVIQELLKLAKEISSSEAAGNDLGLTREEKSFYDALTQPQAVHDVYTNEELVTMTKELTEILRKNRTIDWQKKESARAGMRKMIKRLLKKYHYPPEEAANALETVIRQCEQWTDNEMPVNEPKVYHLYESDYPMAAAERVEYNKK